MKLGPIHIQTTHGRKLALARARREGELAMIDKLGEEQVIVYTVTMHAIYDHGCAGVFSSQQAAVEHARKMAEDSDGHHDFRVEIWELDEGIEIPGRFGWMGWLDEEGKEAERAKRKHRYGVPEITVRIGGTTDE